MIPKEIIDLITDTARIDEVVGDFVVLKKRGSNLIGLCPFHHEKTPSFNVNPARNIYKCFGCGKGGDAVNFIMEHETASYPEALRFLAEKYNIEVQEEERSPERTSQDLLRESLLSATSFASQYFMSQLSETDEGKSVGLSYFREREIADRSVQQFQLGYSPDSWSAFTDAAIAAGYKLEYLEKTGLTISKDGRHYDRFRGRVIFPIHSVSGKVIAFGGRTLKSDPKQPKYVNSPESEIYHKSNVLYGIFFAKRAIVQKEECYLVEGYTDVISMHQSGIENVVASSGTALTVEQIRLISRYTKNITVLYDGDPAGIKASLRGIDLILEQGLNVRVVLFPEGEDPDSFARSHSNSEVLTYLHENATDFIRFKTSLLLQDVQNDPIGKTKLIHEIVNTIALIPDAIMRSSYLKECSTLMDMSEQVLLAELNKILRARFRKQDDAPELAQRDELLPSEETDQIEEDYIHLHEVNIIRLMLNYGNEEIVVDEIHDHGIEDLTRKVMSVIANELLLDEIYPGDPVLRRIFEEFVYLVKNNIDYTADRFVRHEDHEIRHVAADLLTSRHNLSENWVNKGITVKSEKDTLKYAVLSNINTLKTGRIEQLLLENRERIKKADERDMDDLLAHHQELETLKAQLAGYRGIVILK